MIRWIGYTSQSIPGNPSFELGFYTSLDEAKEALLDFCKGVYSDECSMTLYGTPSVWKERKEMIESAKDFKGVGCPFDYPDRIITRGPRGGIKIEEC